MEGNETESITDEWIREELAAKTANASFEGSSSDLYMDDLNTIIQKRREECEALHSTMPLPDPSSGPYCPRVFDGWSCWNDTPAGTTAYVQCPTFVTGFHPELMGHKICDENGVWFTHPMTNQSWSNYTTCVDMSGENYLNVDATYIAGYSISLIALSLSLFIFFKFKSLKCKRITIHKNLFISFIINNAMWIIWYECVVHDPTVPVDNGVACQVLHVFLHYFLISNYFWMFCEGLYLHTLLVVAFVSESRIMKWFVLLGWGFPAILIIIYGAARGSDSTARQHCWMEDGPYNYILTIPVVISIVLNLIFLMNIVRVLVTKLRAVNAAPDTHSTRKAVRATLILIPLLGLHFFITPFRPPEGSKAEVYYLYVQAIVASFQGLAVSLLFCFFNGEVLSTFKKKWDQRKLMGSTSQSYAATTLSTLEDSTKA